MISSQFWPPPRAARNPIAKACGRGRGRRERGRGVAFLDDVEEPLPIEDDVDAKQASADDDEQVLETPDAELLQAAAWELSSDGDSDGNEHQQAGHTRATRAGVSKCVLSAVTHGSRPPALGRSSLSLRHPVSGPDAPPAARFASPGHRVAATDAPRHICFLGRRDERSLWPKILHSQNSNGQCSYLRLSVTWGKQHSDCKAVCYLHEGCGRSRSMRMSRPIGELWAWLEYGMTAKDKAEHVLYEPPLSARTSARASFESIGDAAAEFLAAEAGGIGLGEPME